MSRLENKMTKEMLWIYILRLLQERPHYGYEIKELVKKRFGFQPATVSGYAIIYRLIKDGLIEEQARGDSKRKYYDITEEGLRAMQRAKDFINQVQESVFDLTE
ncbi:PadR family transcriptional regulator [Candidatus Thorarchaeota archaeon]|nr:MAG: PadR family transcriptional regulator [Candidatus Thorarchaeota archaeon]